MAGGSGEGVRNGFREGEDRDGNLGPACTAGASIGHAYDREAALRARGRGLAPRRDLSCVVSSVPHPSAVFVGLRDGAPARRFRLLKDGHDKHEKAQRKPLSICGTLSGFVLVVSPLPRVRCATLGCVVTARWAGGEGMFEDMPHKVPEQGDQDRFEVVSALILTVGSSQLSSNRRNTVTSFPETINSICPSFGSV